MCDDGGKSYRERSGAEDEGPREEVGRRERGGGESGENGRGANRLLLSIPPPPKVDKQSVAVSSSMK